MHRCKLIRQEDRVLRHVAAPEAKGSLTKLTPNVE